MFKKILVANRGEIAARIIRACREMGIAAVAVYSEADRRSLHAQLADEALCIGPPAARDSYLSIERIVQAALQSGADAVHPGYGFLAENAEFARAVQLAGLAFIGPPPQAIEVMGDKGRSRALAQQAGVPVAPGYQGEDGAPVLAAQAAEIGYPLMVKAAAGGGGKGMRVVLQAEDLPEALAAARREALHAFGDQRLILERYVPRARHIEFQVLGDSHGSLVHLFERECSVQRRHQKIIEESPSPFVDDDLRAQMGAAAVRAARACGYENAGTVEFIVDPQTRAFYFLEMNTRLQVEHPVTEMITGIDLVQWQIRIAAGEPLPFRQEDLRRRGCAIECRLYAEDPANNFLPAAGKLLRFVEPKGPGVRVESGFARGGEITTHYDPLIAKVITWAETRPAAIRRMAAALQETVILGLVNNGQFLQDALAAPGFQSGEVYTTWVEDYFGDWQPRECTAPPEVVAAAGLIGAAETAPAAEAAAGLIGAADTAPAAEAAAGIVGAAGTAPAVGTALTAAGCDPYSPWRVSSAPQVQINGQVYTVGFERRGEALQVVVNGQPYALEVIDTQPGQVSLRLDGKPATVQWAGSGEEKWFSLNGCTYRLEKPAPRTARAAQSTDGRGAGSRTEGVRSPMPAQVRAVQVREGEQGEYGATLLLLEAMKMEIRIKAPARGRVTRLLVASGQAVEKEQLLAEVEPEVGA